jgi:hypothetical protein
LADSSAPVALGRFAGELPAAFPAIEANAGSWLTYARSFGQWLAFAGLAQLDKDGLSRIEEGAAPDYHLLAGAAPVRVRGVFPQGPAGPAEALLLFLAEPETQPRPDERKFRSALRDLTVLGAVALDARDNVTLARANLVEDGEIATDVINELVRAMPGATDALDALIAEPWLPPTAVGGMMRDSIGAGWSEATTVSNGKYLRSWARLCGVRTRMRPPVSSRHDGEGQARRRESIADAPSNGREVGLF